MVLLITNLAYEIYKLRSELPDCFPDLFGADRLDFVNWFLIHAPREYNLDAAFFVPVFVTLAQSEKISRLVVRLENNSRSNESPR